MFGIKFIANRVYQELVADNQTLRDRVELLESQLTSMTQDATELGESAEKWEKLCSERRITMQHLGQERDRVTLELRTQSKNFSEMHQELINIERNYEAAIAHNIEQDKMLRTNSQYQESLKDEITDITTKYREYDSANKQLRQENLMAVEKIHDAIAAQNQAEQLRNEATIQLGLTKAEFQNYRISVQVAVDNLAIAVNQNAQNQ